MVLGLVPFGIVMSASRNRIWMEDSGFAKEEGLLEFSIAAGFSSSTPIFTKGTVIDGVGSGKDWQASARIIRSHL